MGKEKLELSIGKVAKIVGVETHTIRFWCNELSELLHPKRGFGNRRYYDENTIEILKRVKYLMHDEGMSLAGVKKKITSSSNPEQSFDDQNLNDRIEDKRILQILGQQNGIFRQSIIDTIVELKHMKYKLMSANEVK